MATKSGDDLILRAVQDVAGLREEQRDFSRRIVELTENYGQQLRAVVQGYAKRTDEKLSGMSAAFTVLAQNQTRVDRELKEHDQRLRKLEHLAADS